MGPERQTGKLKPYVANMLIKLWWTNLLQQWGRQINIASIPGTEYEEFNCDMLGALGEVIDTGNWEKNTTCTHDPKTGHHRDWISKFIK